MSEVWKSQGRYFCEICKSWMADNRASREIHEGGMKHKEAVKAKIKEQGIKAAQREKAQRKQSSALLAMERAALESMRANGEGIEHGPDLPATGLRVNVFDPKNFRDIRSMADEMARRKRATEARERETEEREIIAKQLAEQATKVKEEVMKSEALHMVVPEEKVWVEADAGNGKTYYWHMYTGESSWTAPSNFFTAVEYQRRVNEIEAQTTAKQSGVKRPAVDDVKPCRPDKILKQEEQQTLSNLPTLGRVATEPETDEILLPREIPLPSGAPPPPEVKSETIDEPEKEMDSMAIEGTSSEVKTEVGDVQPESVEVTEEEQAATAAKPSAYGGWVRVKKEEQSNYVSPLTAKYRAEEEKEQREADERNKYKREEKKIVFEEKTAPVLTKKTPKVVEFKKKSGPKNVRKREETV